MSKLCDYYEIHIIDYNHHYSLHMERDSHSSFHRQQELSLLGMNMCNFLPYSCKLLHIHEFPIYIHRYLYNSYPRLIVHIHYCTCRRNYSFFNRKERDGEKKDVQKIQKLFFFIWYLKSFLKMWKEIKRDKRKIQKYFIRSLIWCTGIRKNSKTSHYWNDVHSSTYFMKAYCISNIVIKEFYYSKSFSKKYVSISRHQK